MRYFPAFLDLTSGPCLVVGGGAAAARKVRLLQKAGARVTVVAPEASAELRDLATRGALELLFRPFDATDVAGKALVQAATSLDAVDRAVSEAARRAGVPVNVVDRPDLSSFVMPAIVDRDPLVIGISSGAAAPLLARRVRQTIEALLPPRLGRLARFAEAFRGAVAANRTDHPARLRFWERFFDGPIAQAVLAGDERRAGADMLTLVNIPESEIRDEGLVALVGAGPGDPDLLTLRALRLIQGADVLIHDRLVGDGILDHARRDAERIDVGKAKGRPSHSQSATNRLMVDRARAGQRVVRLKGGDPFVFGRGGEELDHLRRAGVRVEIVPGITAATGCAAAAGIPLTHRDHASAVTFVTGHGQNGEPNLDWAALARVGQTLVVYMGLSTAGQIAERLMAHGLDAATPAAIVENGTRAKQRVMCTTLAALGRTVQQEGVSGPALIIIGQVAATAHPNALPEVAQAV